MADHTHITNSTPRASRSSGNSVLAFIVGGLVVAIAVVAWIMLSQDEEIFSVGTDNLNITVEGDSAVDDAAQSIEGAAAGAADAVQGAAEATEDAVSGN